MVELLCLSGATIVFKFSNENLPPHKPRKVIIHESDFVLFRFNYGGGEGRAVGGVTTLHVL